MEIEEIHLAHLSSLILILIKKQSNWIPHEVEQQNVPYYWFQGGSPPTPPPVGEKNGRLTLVQVPGPGVQRYLLKR